MKQVTGKVWSTGLNSRVYLKSWYVVLYGLFALFFIFYILHENILYPDYWVLGAFLNFAFKSPHSPHSSPSPVSKLFEEINQRKQNLVNPLKKSLKRKKETTTHTHIYILGENWSSKCTILKADDKKAQKTKKILKKGIFSIYRY